MTLQELCDYVMTIAQRRVGDEYEVVKRHVNDAYSQLCLRTGATKTTTTLTLTTSKPDYSLSRDLGLSILRLLFIAYTPVVTSGSNALRLEPLNVSSLLERRQYLTNTSGISTRYYALFGQDTLMLYPGGGAGDTMTVYYAARPVILDQPSDEPSSLPDEFHDLVALGAISRCAKQPQVALAYRQEFEQGVARLRGFLNTQDTATSVLIDSHRLVAAPRDPSTDTGW